MGPPHVARIPRLTRAMEVVVSLFLARLSEHFLALPSGFFFLFFSLSPRAP